MTTIDLTIEKSRRANAIKRAKERSIVIPTYAQMKDPSKIPAKVKDELKNIGLWDIHPRNLFRINWHNEPSASGGTFGGVNYLELPSSLTGVPARIVVLIGKWFPTGAHKVGAAFSCLVPRLVTGQFDPTTQKAVWPSTGNYCRGGAYRLRIAWPVTRSPSCPKACRRNASNGCPKSLVKRSRPQAQSPTSRKSSISAGN